VPNPHFNPDPCIPGAVSDTYYLETVSLAGQLVGTPHRVSDSGIDDTDCGGHTVTPATIAWVADERR
jgi:hypothetical protein